MRGVGALTLEAVVPCNLRVGAGCKVVAPAARDGKIVDVNRRRIGEWIVERRGYCDCGVDTGEYEDRGVVAPETSPDRALPLEDSTHQEAESASERALDVRL